MRGLRGGLLGWLLIVGLVAGGLGWATASALRLEREQFEARRQAELAERLRLALWRLDSRVSPILAREDARPANHYSVIHAPALALRNDGTPLPVGSVLALSPLLDADLPEWLLLHFQVDAEAHWGSPQVPFEPVARRLRAAASKSDFRHLTPERAALLRELSQALPARDVLALAQGLDHRPTVRDRAVVFYPSSNSVYAGRGQGPAQEGSQTLDNDLAQRFSQQQKFQNQRGEPHWSERELTNVLGQGLNWIQPGNKKTASGEVPVTLSPMTAGWTRGKDGQYRLLYYRLVRVGEQVVCQGIVLDAGRLEKVLREEIVDLFPNARLVPVRDQESQPERTMAALPLALEPGDYPSALVPPAWTPLRTGLALAWAAAAVALLAVGLGGWALLDLSERRFRFVSAVTHELRTPLTTLRLYLDMLLGGMVRDEARRQEYVETMHRETDRLTRLIGNVLDYARLEKQRPRVRQAVTPVAALLEQTREAWESRCKDAGKELVLDNPLPADFAIVTDDELVSQVLGNLIDNACKYSRDAEDPRLWVRVRGSGKSVLFEVEDLGPGVPAGQRQAIFRPFRRGPGADVRAGGVGLGLALAERWAKLLGGRLTLCPGQKGACFRLELPASEDASTS